MNTPNYVYCNYRLNHGKWNKFLLNGLIFSFMQSHTHLYKVAGVAIDVEGKEMGEKKSHLQSEKNWRKILAF